MQEKKQLTKPTPIHDKISQQIRIREELLQLD